MAQTAESTIPIVIDLGKTRRKDVKRLKRGRGKLMDEIRQVMAEVQANLGEETEGKELVPVVILYRRRGKRGKQMGVWPFR